MDTNLSRMVKSPNLGNGIAASSDLAAGSVIIHINEPYLVIAENAVLDRVCSHCLYEKASLKRCTGCKTVQYCSSRCQSSSWKATHKTECPIYKALPGIPPTPVRGLMNLLIRKELCATSNPRWVGLEGHEDSLQRQKRWDEIILQAKAAVEFTKSPANSLESVINVLCRMTTNAFRVTLADNTPIGLCFEPIISLANHSCTPNATIIFDGRKIELRALDEIKKDEQIFISYIDPTQDKETRQAELKFRYFFPCECEKCARDDNAYATFLKGNPAPFSKLDLFVDPTNLIEFARSRCRSSNIPTIPSLALPPHPENLHDRYLSLLDASQYVPALILLLSIYLHCDVYLYPQPHHPIRVIRLFTIARLLKQVASIQDDRELMLGIKSSKCEELVRNIDFVSAVQVLLILIQELGAKSHGRTSAFTREVGEELGEVEEVQRRRGMVGERLREWGIDEDVEGREYASKIFEVLRELAKFTDGIVPS